MRFDKLVAFLNWLYDPALATIAAYYLLYKAADYAGSDWDMAAICFALFILLERKGGRRA